MGDAVFVGIDWSGPQYPHIGEGAFLTRSGEYDVYFDRSRVCVLIKGDAMGPYGETVPGDLHCTPHQRAAFDEGWRLARLRGGA